MSSYFRDPQLNYGLKYLVLYSLFLPVLLRYRHCNERDYAMEAVNRIAEAEKALSVFEREVESENSGLSLPARKSQQAEELGSILTT